MALPHPIAGRPQQRHVMSSPLPRCCGVRRGVYSTLGHQNKNLYSVSSSKRVEHSIGPVHGSISRFIGRPKRVSTLKSSSRRRRHRRERGVEARCEHMVEDSKGKYSGESQSATMKLLHAINESTKWVVSGLAFASLLGNRDALTAWCIIGGVINAMLCRFLKFAINASRPSAARKRDPGMPSSHACSLGFLSIFVSLALYHSTADFGWFASLPVLPPVLGAFLTSLRVILGYHTVPQVLVGWILGSSTSWVWYHMGVNKILPLLEETIVGSYCLILATCTFVALFAVKNVLRWHRESR